MARIDIPIVEATHGLGETINKLKAMHRSAVGVRAGRDLKIIPAWQLIQARESGIDTIGNVKGGTVYRSEQMRVKNVMAREAPAVRGTFRPVAMQKDAARASMRIESVGAETAIIIGTSGILRIANGVPMCQCRNPLRKPPHSYTIEQAQQRKWKCFDHYDIVCP